MRKRARCLAALGAATLILAAAALPSAARTLDAIRADGTLRVGMTGDYAPFSLRGADGNFTGADVTMAQSLAKSLGVALVIVPTHWPTLTADFQADRFDVAMGGVTVTRDRAAIGDFSVAILHDGKRPIVRCADRGIYTSLAAIDRPTVRVIVNPGGTNERFAKAHFARALLREYPDNRRIFDELAAGHADVMVTDGAEVDYQSRLHPGKLCPAMVADAFDHADKAYWMSRDPALKHAVDSWLIPSLRAGIYRRALSDAATHQAVRPQ